MQHNQQQINPDHHRRRARLHLWQDGIFEILIGLAAMLFSGFSVVLPSFGEAAPVHIIIEVTMMAVLFFVGFVVFRQTSETAKSRITYPRSGFVRLRREHGRVSLATVVLCVPISAGLGIGLSVVLVIGMGVLGIASSLFLLSGLLALSAIVLARRVHQYRFYWLAAGMLVIGAALSAFGPQGELGIMLLFLLVGLLTMLSGCVVLWRYLQRHSLQEDTDYGRF